MIRCLYILVGGAYCAS